MTPGGPLQEADLETLQSRVKTLESETRIQAEVPPPLPLVEHPALNCDFLPEFRRGPHRAWRQKNAGFGASRLLPDGHPTALQWGIGPRLSPALFPAVVECADSQARPPLWDALFPTPPAPKKRKF